MSFRVSRAGSAALAALRGGPATVFAAFERSCYVETPTGIACLGGVGLGLGPLNAVVENFEVLPVGSSVIIETGQTSIWKPSSIVADKKFPEVKIPEAILGPARSFLDWISDDIKPDDSLIGLGPGLTPAGDDFVGGAMIALRMSDHGALADRIAAWALPLAATNTSRISRAHLECAARGEGHAYFHDFLASPTSDNLEKLARVGHTSGLDAAAGAVNALTHTNQSCNPDVVA